MEQVKPAPTGEVLRLKVEARARRGMALAAIRADLGNPPGSAVAAILRNWRARGGLPPRRYRARPAEGPTESFGLVLPIDLIAWLVDEGEARGLGRSGFIKTLLEAIRAGDLVDAVLDEPALARRPAGDSETGTAMS